MTFWDASALVPLFFEQPLSGAVRAVRPKSAETIGLWWGSVVECWSAFARLRREGLIDRDVERKTRERLHTFLEAHGFEIAPSEELRARAGTLLGRHDLRAADALQLAAAIAYFGVSAEGVFVTLDKRLNEAARLEGLGARP